MKKLGFTLAEVLVSLAIVGVIAAVIGPAISNIAPDKNKSTYIDYYGKISNVIENSLNDSGIYGRNYIKSADGQYYELEKCIDLGCTSAAMKSGYSSASGLSKLAWLIAKDWGLDSSDYSLGATSTLTTKDDIEFVIEAEAIDIDGEDGINHTITMKLTGGGKPCIYNPNTECRFPRWYVYNVDTFGNVTPGDFLGKAYLRNTKTMNDKQKDYDCAKALYNGNACTD